MLGCDQNIINFAWVLLMLTFKTKLCKLQSYEAALFELFQQPSKFYQNNF